MMAAMGYRAGTGLGPEGRGRAVPLLVGVKGSGGTRGLGDGGDDERKLSDAPPLAGVSKAKRGGARKRAAVEAAAARAAAAAEREAEPTFFSVINRSLAKPGCAPQLAGSEREPLQRAGSTGPPPTSTIAGGQQQRGGAKRPAAVCDRAQLMRQHDGISALQAKVQRYTEMLARNKCALFRRRSRPAVSAPETASGRTAFPAQHAILSWGAAKDRISSQPAPCHLETAPRLPTSTAIDGGSAGERRR